MTHHTEPRAVTRRYTRNPDGTVTMSSNILQDVVSLDEAEIGSIVTLKACNCGDAHTVDGMEFEKVGMSTSGAKLDYWRRVK